MHPGKLEVETPTVANLADSFAVPSTPLDQSALLARSPLCNITHESIRSTPCFKKEDINVTMDQVLPIEEEEGMEDEAV